MLVALLLLILEDPRLLIERGVAALKANDLATARAQFESAAKQSPASAAAWMLLAQTRAQQGELKAAAEAAVLAERFGGKDPAILQGLANFYGSLTKDLPRAADMGARYAAVAPASDTGAWARVAALYLAIGKPVEAIAAGLKGKPSPELSGTLGRAYLERKDWAKADAAFDAAVKLNPYDEQPRFAAAQARLLHQDFAGAVQVILDARKVFDKSAQLELTLGVAYYGQRKFDRAVDQFLLAMRLNPDLPQPYAFLGRILEHAGDRLPEATQRFEALEQMHPESSLGYLLHAKALVAQFPSGFPPEAARALELVEKSLSIAEADADAQLQLGALLYRRGDLAAAATHLERSAALNAKDSAAHFQLARLYAAMGRKEDAARERALHEKYAEQEKAK